jgi:hypothetical protein
MLCLVRPSFAQQLPVSEKKNIKDQNGAIFWNLELPAYIQLSTSPDGKDALPLTEVRSEAMKKHVYPLYFDGHGVHYLRHMDHDNPIQEQEIAFAVNVDGLAPKSTLTLDGAPSFYNSKLFFGKNLKGTMSAKDQMSGVEASYLSMNDAAYAVTTDAINFEVEKGYNLKYLSVDKVGNIEKVQTKSFTVDLSPPVSIHSVTIDQLAGNVLSPRSLLKLSSQDNLSGVKRIDYSLDANNPIKYVSKVSLYALTDGEHKLTYYATDQVSNKEVEKNLNFYYDKTAPEVTSSIDANFVVKNGKTYIAKATKVKLTATDNKAGVREILYLINGAETVYSGPFTLPQKQGGYKVSFRAVDKVSNKGKITTNEQLKSIFLDDTPPVINHVIRDKSIFTRDTLFITKNSSFKLSNVDRESGSAKIEYQLDNGESQTYVDPFSIEKEGLHTLEYQGYDFVNNVSSKKMLFIVDNTGPAIFNHMSLEKIGTQKLTDIPGETPIYAAGTSIYLAATDEMVGTKTIYYTLDKLTERVYGAAIKLASKGSHTLQVRATDYLGNETVLDPITFIIQ